MYEMVPRDTPVIFGSAKREEGYKGWLADYSLVVDLPEEDCRRKFGYGVYILVRVLEDQNRLWVWCEERRSFLAVPETFADQFWSVPDEDRLSWLSTMYFMGAIPHAEE